MEKVGEDEENAIEETSNSVQETTTRKEDEGSRSVFPELIDPVDSMEAGSTNSPYSHTHTVTFEVHDVNESVMEEREKILEFSNHDSGVTPEVAKSSEMKLQLQEETRTKIVLHSLNDNTNIADVSAMDLNPLEILEGNKSSSDSNEATEDSSSTSDLDFSLYRYYFDGSLPLSAHVEESETNQDEYSGPNDENQMPLLCPKQRMLQTTSWRNCCGLLELLRAADP